MSHMKIRKKVNVYWAEKTDNKSDNDGSYRNIQRGPGRDAAKPVVIMKTRVRGFRFLKLEREINLQ